MPVAFVSLWRPWHGRNASAPLSPLAQVYTGGDATGCPAGVRWQSVITFVCKPGMNETLVSASRNTTTCQAQMTVHTGRVW